MRGHGLRQAIARVNRVFRHKPGGLVVDSLGIADQLKQALIGYTERHRAGAGIPIEEAVAVLKEKHEVVTAMFPGFHWSGYAAGDAGTRLRLLLQGANRVTASDHMKRRFLDALAWAKQGKTVLLVPGDTNSEDVEGMLAAVGILTGCGGITLQAALVAGGWGNCCIVGAGALGIVVHSKRIRVGDVTLREGDVLILNGPAASSTRVPCQWWIPPRIRASSTLWRWRTVSGRRVRTNADNPEDAATAIEFGAEGIGFFRTQHMFYGKGSEQPPFLERKMTVASSERSGGPPSTSCSLLSNATLRRPWRWWRGRR